MSWSVVLKALYTVSPIASSIWDGENLWHNCYRFLVRISITSVGISLHTYCQIEPEHKRAVQGSLDVECTLDTLF